MLNTLKKAICICVCLVMIFSLAACGKSDAYSSYSKAFSKTAEPKSLHILFDLALDDGSETVTSTGDMKVNANNEVYYEMTLNGKDIVQYVKNGTIHTLVDGKEQTSTTDNKDSGTERANPEGGKGKANEKTDNSGFNVEKFLEEFSGMLEAGKIKQTGVLDPIPSRYIKEIKTEKSGSNTLYTMTFPDEFLSALLKVLTEEQTKSTGMALEFSKLKDFVCVSRENSSGYLDAIEYKGYTTVKVPAELMDSGKEESFDLHIDLNMEIQNPGSAVEVVIPN